MDEEEIFSEFENEKKKLKSKYIFIIVIVAIIVAVFSSEFTLYYYTKNNFLAKSESSEDADENIDAISETLKNFRKVIDKLYIGEIDEQKVLDETIKGYVNGLDDEYSQYFTAEEWEEFETQALGNYVGIGVYMGIDEDDNIVIVAPIKSSPAESAGLQKGDIIVKVDDENVTRNVNV
jgi:carboxyl-terminal processing protease